MRMGRTFIGKELRISIEPGNPVLAIVNYTPKEIRIDTRQDVPKNYSILTGIARPVWILWLSFFYDVFLLVFFRPFLCQSGIAKILDAAAHLHQMLSKVTVNHFEILCLILSCLALTLL